MTSEDRERLTRIERKLDEALAAHNQTVAVLAVLLRQLADRVEACG